MLSKKQKLTLLIFAPLITAGCFYLFSHIGKPGRPQVFEIITPAVYADPLEIRSADLRLRLKPVNAEKSAGQTAKNAQGESEIIYSNAFAETDVSQVIYAYKIKEDLILKKPGHPAEFQYEVDAAGLTASKDEQGNWNFFTEACSSEMAEQKKDSTPLTPANVLNTKNQATDAKSSACAEATLSRVFSIPAPYMIDANNERSLTADVETSLKNGILTIRPSSDWLKKHKYPIRLDPTVEIAVINVHSQPLQGDEWIVNFTTSGQADLIISPNDQATVDDDEFISLWCGDEQIQNSLSPNGGEFEIRNYGGIADVIYFKDWQCAGTGKIIHKTLKAGDHILKFQFGDEIEYAYNNYIPGHLYAWGENIGWINASSTYEQVTVADNGLTGFAWGENIGWIKFDYDGVAGATNTTEIDWGVTNDGLGNLGGYAWGENIGWLNFYSSSSRVTINLDTGQFNGFAWGENIGWVNFAHLISGYEMTYASPPKVTTGAARSVGSNVATLVGIAYRYGSDITERGFKYGLTAVDTWSSSESGTYNSGEFSKVISDLIPGQTYYFRAYAINGEGTAYGEYVQFTAETEHKGTPMIFKGGQIFNGGVILK
jgi:hypothetical protein